MADFETAYKRTARFEGGYVNDPTDRGGETYNGISRVSNPTWPGWPVIDALKGKSGFPGNLKTDAIKNKLNTLVYELYLSNYWVPIWGDRIKNQKVANDMYDTAVNMGPATSIKLSERQFKLSETGKMSEKLLNELNRIV